MQLASGKFIVFLDSDDILTENAISVLYKSILYSNSDIAIARIQSFNSKGVYNYYSDKYINEYIECSVHDKRNIINCISVCSKIYRKSIIEKNPFLVKTIHEDNGFTLSILYKANKIVLIPECLYKRRIREDENNRSIMQTLNYKAFLDLEKNYKYALKRIYVKNKKCYLNIYKYMIRKLNNEIVKYVEPNKGYKAKLLIKKFINSLELKGIIKKYLLIYNKGYQILINIYRGVKRI